MRKIILIFVIQLLYHIPRVESLFGHQIFTPIRSGELPFVASFQYFPGEQNFCGGALITKKHVLTSADCVRNVSRESFRIVFEVANGQGPALTYTAASWTTYVDWARRHGIPYERPDKHSAAIVVLTGKVYHVNPVPLNALTKRQLAGTEAKMIGWSTIDVLSKATVQLLSNEDCERSYHVLRNDMPAIDDRALCTAANPFALLSGGDIGSPLLHARDNSLLGIAFASFPGDEHVRGNFSTEFVRQHQDLIAVIGGTIGAMRIPEKWLPGKVDLLLNSHNIMHVMVVVAVCSMHTATVQDLAWMIEPEVCLTVSSSLQHDEL